MIARIVEPTSKADAARVLADLGADTVSYRTIQRHLAKVNTGNYRDAIAEKCFTHAADRGGLSLLLYDVTTLYFEAENEDDLRKVGYSKERRVDPQIVVGLLVDRTGFPLEIGCFEGNTAETTTIVPIITAFAERHDLGETPMVVAADAGMLSAANLTALDEAGLGFIVGSRSGEGPDRSGVAFPLERRRFHRRADHRHRHPPACQQQRQRHRAAGRTGLEPRRSSGAWRAIWAYSAKRARRDQKTLTPKKPAPGRSSTVSKQPNPPGSSRPRRATAPSTKPAWPARSRWSGLKGYVTNVPAE